MYKLKEKFLLIMCSILLLFLSACSNINTNPKNRDNSNQTSNTTFYPLSFKDSYNREVKINNEPKRIISAAPNITEIVCALGKKDKLIGRTDFCDYPNDVKNIQSIGGIQNPNIEKIIELKPDLVIASSFFTKESLQKLEALNVKVVVISNNNSLEGTYNIIKKVGEIITAESEANKIVYNMNKKITSVLDKVKDKPTPVVYYVMSYGRAGNFTAGKNTFIGNLINMAGGKNAADDVNEWAYSIEKLIEKNPDILICSNTLDTKSGIKTSNGYRDLKAVKNDKIYEINSDILNRQGPRLADGFEELAKIVHPEAFK